MPAREAITATAPSGGQNQLSVVGVAVVGTGYWGPNLIRNFVTLPGAKLAMVCDLDPSRLAAISSVYPDVRVTTQLEDVLLDPQVSAVAVATPAESHRQIGEACLKAGKHVYVEKPLATKVDDAISLARTAEEVDRILMVGHLFVYDPAISRLLDVVKGGGVGRVLYVHGVRTSMAGTARLDTSIAWDALIHDAYILPLLLGEPVRVMATGRGYLSPALEDVTFATFVFDDGVLANVYSSWYALEKERKIVVVGSEALIVYDDLAAPKLTVFHRRYRQDEDKDPMGRTRWHWCDEGRTPIPTPSVEPLRAECAHFIECIQYGRSPRTDGRAGVEAVRLVEAVQRSIAECGAPVQVQRMKGVC